MSTPVKTKRAKATTTKGHYITNAVLLPEVIRAKKLGQITNELAKMFMLIAERYSFKANFAGYSFREDMVSFATSNLCANGLKFDPEKSDNPFSYYTSAIHNSFLQYLAEESKHRDIRDQLILESGAMPSSTYMSSSDGDHGGAYDEYGEITHSGYSEFKPAPTVEPEPVKRVKQPSNEQLYLERAKEIGYVPNIDEEFLEEANKVKQRRKKSVEDNEEDSAPPKKEKVVKIKEPKVDKKPKKEKVTESKKTKNNIVDYE